MFGLGTASGDEGLCEGFGAASGGQRERGCAGVLRRKWLVRTIKHIFLITSQLYK